MDSPLFRPAALAAAACTIVQACAWMVLGLLGLLSAVEVMGPTKAEHLSSYATPVGVFNLQVVGCYFPRPIFSLCCENKLLLSGDPLEGISIVYMVLSFVWLCIGVQLLQALQKQKSLSHGLENKTANLTLAWAAVTGLISLLDFVVVILFGIDYNKMSNNPYCVGSLVITGMLMSLAARGYVLWVFNVVAAVLLGRYAVKANRTESRRSSSSSNSTVYNSPADAVQDSRSMVFQRNDRPWVGDSVSHQPRSPPVHQPPLAAWDRPDGRGGAGASPRSRPSEPPTPSIYPELQRGGLAARMTQGPSSMAGSTRGPPPLPPAQYQQQQQQQQKPHRSIPEPDYDAGGNGPRRSALKKTPSKTPSPDWQQANNRWQTPQTPVSPNGQGGWQPSASPGGWQGYDNRGYNNQGYDNSGRQGDGSAGRWGRTGF